MGLRLSCERRRINSGVQTANSGERTASGTTGGREATTGGTASSISSSSGSADRRGNNRALRRLRPGSQGLRRFKTAVRRVIHLLRLRRRWSAYGKILQQLPRKDLWEGLERRGGVLFRIRPARVDPPRWMAPQGGHLRHPQMQASRPAHARSRRRMPNMLA